MNVQVDNEVVGRASGRREKYNDRNEPVKEELGMSISLKTPSYHMKTYGSGRGIEGLVGSPEAAPR